MRRFDAIWAAIGDERQQNYQDRRFCTIRGAQWEGWVEDDVEAVTPRMEVNKTHKSVIRIFSEYRNNRVSVDFRAKDHATERATVDSLDGLYRSDEYESDGQDAYDNAFDEGVSGGIGAWRVIERYEDDEDDDERQRIAFEPIYDADLSVFFDLDDKRQEKEDSRFAFEIVTMSREAFEDEHPDASASSFTDIRGRNWGYEWCPGPDVIKIAKYYEVERKTVVSKTFTNIASDETQRIDEGDLTDERLAELAATGWEETKDKERKVKKQRVRLYLLSGGEVLSDEGLIAGPNIPLVMFYGKRWVLNGIERSMGHTRLAIDSQRVYNTVISSLVEIAGGDPREKPVFTPEQVQGHEDSWAEADRNRSPYLLLNPMVDADGNSQPLGEIARVQPAQVPPSTAALVQIMAADIADLTGESDQMEDVPSNVSAKAIELVHNRVDIRNFIYMDNFRKAVRRCGEIWLGKARELYVEEGREMRTIDGNGEQGKVTLAEPALDVGGDQFLKNDLTTGRYEVIVDVGPSSTTRRDATVKALVGMANAATAAGDTELANACMSLALMTMDGEGLDDLQDWIRNRLVQQGIVKPNEQEKAAMEEAAQNAQPDPQQQLVLAAAQQATAQAKEAEANALKNIAQAELAKAKAAEALAGIDADKRDAILKAFEIENKYQPTAGPTGEGATNGNAA